MLIFVFLFWQTSYRITSYNVCYTKLLREGTVANFQWANPHTWIQVEAPGPDGTVSEWSVECSSPNTLSRQGWTPGLLAPGQPIVIVINPMRDGTSAGLFVGMQLEDGQVS